MWRRLIIRTASSPPEKSKIVCIAGVVQSCYGMRSEGHDRPCAIQVAIPGLVGAPVGSTPSWQQRSAMNLPPGRRDPSISQPGKLTKSNARKVLGKEVTDVGVCHHFLTAMGCGVGSRLLPCDPCTGSGRLILANPGQGACAAETSVVFRYPKCTQDSTTINAHAVLTVEILKTPSACNRAALTVAMNRKIMEVWSLLHTHHQSGFKSNRSSWSLRIVAANPLQAFPGVPLR